MIIFYYEGKKNMGLWDFVGMRVGELGDAFSRARENAEHSTADSIQSKVDRITTNVQRGALDAFTFQDKLFLRGLYYSMAAGGRLKDMPEASQLIVRYLQNQAEPPLMISAEIYQTSAVVKRDMERQKKLAATAIASGKMEFVVDFRDKSHMLLAERSNKRLFYANNRFWLYSNTKRQKEGKYLTKWSVLDRYVFEDFQATQSSWKRHSLYSEFPYRNQKLRIYDGLSRALVKLELAKEFDNNAEWTEEWVVTT